MAGPVFRILAEEVYALHCFKDLKRLEKDTLHPMQPSIKHGVARSVAKVLKELDFDVYKNASDNVPAIVQSTQTEDNETTYNILPIKNTENRVPNVIGMGATDALYTLEKCGLRVSISGKGRVSAQSIQAGSTFSRGQYISITLK